MDKKKKIKIHPYLLIIITFVSVVLIGTFALMLPIAATDGISHGFVDSLFMATSCVCVTGLSVMNSAVEMTVFGKVVMALLMEVGGLSFITIAMFFFTMIGGKIGVGNRFLLKEALNQDSLGGIVALVKKIVITSLVIQAIGAVINYYPFYDFLCETYGESNQRIWDALGMTLFHSAAAFNNAGFDIIGSESLIPFKNDLIINATTMMMIIFGGIGFVVIDDVLRNKRWKRFTLHTKIVLISTIVLVIGGAILLKLTSNMSLLQAMFTSVASRTAGFTTYDLSQLREFPVAYIIVVLLMMIGASPCSCGGGVKTTTLAIIILSIISFATGKKTKAFHRRIAESQISKSFVLVFVAIFLLIFGTVLVCLVQPDASELGFDKILFEVASAFSTTGFSMGITAKLNAASRVVISLMMLLGRSGPLTVIGVLNKNWMTDTKEPIQYVEESVIIG